MKAIKFITRWWLGFKIGWKHGVFIRSPFTMRARDWVEVISAIILLFGLLTSVVWFPIYMLIWRPLWLPCKAAMKHSEEELRDALKPRQPEKDATQEEMYAETDTLWQQAVDEVAKQKGGGDV